MVLLSLNPEVTLNYAFFLNYCFEQSPRDYALGGNVSFRVTSTTNFIYLLHLGCKMSAITLSQNCSNPCVLLSQMQSPDITTPLLRIYHGSLLATKVEIYFLVPSSYACVIYFPTYEWPLPYIADDSSLSCFWCPFVSTCPMPLSSLFLLPQVFSPFCTTNT